MKKNKLKHENYLGFILLLIALMAFAIIVKSCNIAQYQHQQLVIGNDANSAK